MKLKLLTTLGSFGTGVDPKPYEEEIARLSQEVIDLTEQVDACRVEIASLTADVAAKQAEIESLEDEIAAKQARITELETTTTEQAEEIERLQGQYAEALEQISQLNGQIDSLNETINGLNLQLADVSKQLEEANDEIAAQQDTIEEQGKTIVNLTTDLAEKTTALSEAQAEVARLQADVQTLSTQVTDLQAQVQNLSAIITAKDLEIRQKDEYIAYLEEHQGGDGMYVEDGALKGKMFAPQTVTSVGSDVDASELTTANYMFYGSTSLTTVECDFSNLVNGDHMFRECTNLGTFNGDLSHLNHANAMFYGCTSLTEWDIDLPALDYGYYMFYGTDMRTFKADLSNVTNCQYMLGNCPSLQSVDIKFGRATSSAQPWGAMFSGTQGPVTANIESEVLESGRAMFQYNGYIQTFTGDLPAMTDGNQMFYNCRSLTSFSCDLSNLTNGNQMFYSCSFTSWDIPLPSLTNGNQMFMYCPNLTSFDSDLSSLTDGNYMFYNCSTLTTFSVALPSLISGNSMFQGSGMTSFETDLPEMRNGTRMFSDCSGLRSFSGDLSELTNGYDMFWGCNNLTSFTGHLPSLTNGSSMFYNCRLSQASVKRIALSINDLASQGSSGTLTLGMNNQSISEALFTALYSPIFTSKGWTLAASYGDPPGWWNPEQDEPVEWLPEEMTATTLQMLLDAGLEVVLSLSSAAQVLAWVDGKADGSAYGITNCFHATSQYFDAPQKLTIWKDEEWNIQVETQYRSSLDTKLVSVPLIDGRTDLGHIYNDNQWLTFTMNVDENGLSITRYTLEGITAQKQTAHDPAKFGDEYTIYLPNTVDGTGMYQNASLGDEKMFAPVLQNGMDMFNNSSITSFKGDLPSLTDGTRMFNDCVGLTSFSGDLSSLENGNQMFYHTGIEAFENDLPYLTNGDGMFNGCFNLTAFGGDLSSLTDGSYMFFDSSLTTFTSDLASLTEGMFMFYGCALSHASVKHIAETINDLAAQGTEGSITIGVNEQSLTEGYQEKFGEILYQKGWSVDWQRNPAPIEWNPDEEPPTFDIVEAMTFAPTPNAIVGEANKIMGDGTNPNNTGYAMYMYGRDIKAICASEHPTNVTSAEWDVIKDMYEDNAKYLVLTSSETVEPSTMYVSPLKVMEAAWKPDGVLAGESGYYQITYDIVVPYADCQSFYNWVSGTRWNAFWCPNGWGTGYQNGTLTEWHHTNSPQAGNYPSSASLNKCDGSIRHWTDSWTSNFGSSNIVGYDRRLTWDREPQLGVTGPNGAKWTINYKMQTFTVVWPEPTPTGWFNTALPLKYSNGHEMPLEHVREWVDTHPSDHVGWMMSDGTIVTIYPYGAELIMYVKDNDDNYWEEYITMIDVDDVVGTMTFHVADGSQMVFDAVGQYYDLYAIEPERIPTLPPIEADVEDPSGYTINLPDTVDGTNMFADSTSLGNEKVFAPVLENGTSMFRESSITSFEGDLPALTGGGNMFKYCNGLTSFEGDMPSLTNGNTMFRGCTSLTSFNGDLSELTTAQFMFFDCSNLTSWDVDLPKLTEGSWTFQNCSNLTSWRGDLHKLTAGTNMFNGCGNLTSFDCDLSALGGGGGMFSGCKLDLASVNRIANSLPRHTFGVHDITIGVDSTQVTEEQQDAANAKMTSKGWAVEWERNGASDTIDVSINGWQDETRGVPSMPIDFDNWMMELGMNPEATLNLQSFNGDVGLSIKFLMGSTYTMTYYDMDTRETLAEMNVNKTNDSGPGNPRIWTFTDVQSDCSLTFTLYRGGAQPNVIAGTMPSGSGI